MFVFTETRGRVDVAFTDRHGGVSGGPYASLDLAEPRRSDAAADARRAAVRENVHRVAAALAGAAPVPPVVRMSQVHGADVAVVREPVERPPVADGLVTDRPGTVLMVRVADCVPVVLADPERGIVGVAHAGRPGLAAGVVPRTVAALRELGAGELGGWVGPHVCGACYEVPATMRAEVSAVVPEAYAETSWGTPALDIGAGVHAQLRAMGVPVVDASRCTLEDEDLFSYRRQGPASGRLAGLVWVRP